MATTLRARRGLAVVAAGLFAFAGACDRPPASSSGTAHGVAVDGKLTTEPGGLKVLGMCAAAPATGGRWSAKG